MFQPTTYAAPTFTTPTFTGDGNVMAFAPTLAAPTLIQPMVGGPTYSAPVATLTAPTQTAPLLGSLVVGPIIGTVTHSTARILIEPDITGPITINLIAAAQPPISRTLDCLAGIPKAFPFEGLTPKTLYKVRVVGMHHITSSFKTFSPHPTIAEGLKFAVIACNKQLIAKERVSYENDLWRALTAMISSGEVDMALHVGDQVYADNDYEGANQGVVSLQDAIKQCTYLQAMAILQRTPQDQWVNVRQEIMELYRNEYRRTWAHPPTRSALANLPNLMIFDDHEIKDDLGERSEDFNLSSAARFISECGRRVAYDYQRQLHEDFPFLSDPWSFVPPHSGRENHAVLKLGEYGILMLDTRATRLFNAQSGDPLPFLTSRQWWDISSTLSPGGYFSDIRMLVVATQKPIAFLDPQETAELAATADDYQGHWAFGTNSREQTRLLDTLFEWKFEVPYRNVVLAGGDVHLGGYSEIMKEGRRTFRQITVGPIANLGLRDTALAFSNPLSFPTNRLGMGWSFHHQPWINKRNFGVIRVHEGSPQTQYRPLADLSLVQSTERRGVLQSFASKELTETRRVWPPTVGDVYGAQPKREQIPKWGLWYALV